MYIGPIVPCILVVWRQEGHPVRKTLLKKSAIVVEFIRRSKSSDLEPRIWFLGTLVSTLPRVRLDDILDCVTQWFPPVA